MPRHTWTVRIELCDTFDEVSAHAYLENGPLHLSGRGSAPVADPTVAMHSRAEAARRSLLDLSDVMLAAAQHPSMRARPGGPFHAYEATSQDPGDSIFAVSPLSSVGFSSTR
jgi:hypothetical protein